MPPTLPELLKTTIDLQGSDLHLSISTPPQVRVHGKLQRLDLPDLTPTETKQLAYSVMTDAQKKRFEESLELDFSFGIRGVARFRSNVFNQRGAVGAVYRLIPEQIKGFKELGLPQVLATLSDRPRGLVLVTGPTGSGKSTTLAAMIDKINHERNEHILTIEDPHAAVARARGHRLSGAAAQGERRRARRGAGDSGADARDPESDSRGQDPSDLFLDAGGPGEARHADLQSVARDLVHDQASHARSSDGRLVHERRVGPD